MTTRPGLPIKGPLARYEQDLEVKVPVARNGAPPNVTASTSGRSNKSAAAMLAPLE